MLSHDSDDALFIQSVLERVHDDPEVDRNASPNNQPCAENSGMIEIGANRLHSGLQLKARCIVIVNALNLGNGCSKASNLKYCILYFVS